MKYYYLAGVFPFNCSDENFEEDFGNNYLVDAYDSPEEIIKKTRGVGFLRIFKVNGKKWEAVEGYAPCGSKINNQDWKVLSKITYELVNLIPEEKFLEYVKCNDFRYDGK